MSLKYVHLFVHYWRARHLPLIAPASSSSSPTACSPVTISSAATLSISIVLSSLVRMVAMVGMVIVDPGVNSPEIPVALRSKINSSCGKSFGGPQLPSEIVPRPPPQVMVVATSVWGSSAQQGRGAINQGVSPQSKEGGGEHHWHLCQTRCLADWGMEWRRRGSWAHLAW